MVRDIKLYGSLAKAADGKSFRFDCNNQHELLAGLKAQCPQLDMALRSTGSVSIVWTKDDEQVDPRNIEDGFRFSDEAKVIHISPATEGAWWYVIVIIASVVISYAVTRLTMPHNSNSNSGGGRSTMFNGAVNSTSQGGPIPIIYGKKVLVGSTIMGADEDYYNTV